MSTETRDFVDDGGLLTLPSPQAHRDVFDDSKLPTGMNEAAVAARRLVLRQRKAASGAQRQLGAALSSRWLPQGTGWAELDQVREEHLATLSRVADALGRLNGLDEKFTGEDKQRKAAFADAARTGEDPPEFPRTPAAERQQQRDDAEEALWAHVAVLEQVVARAKATLQAHETRWLADLGRTEDADAAVAEAMRRLEDARRARWRATALAQWLKMEVEGGGPGGAFGPQAAPDGSESAPDVFDEGQSGTFERRYFEQERRARVDADPVVLDDDPLGVRVLDEGEPVPDLIEPLDEPVPAGKRA